jgi:hypothetical protein
MTNLLAEANYSDNADCAARIIQDALGIESDDGVNYCFPKEWPADRERRARYIGEWLKTEAAQCLALLAPPPAALMTIS